MHEYELLQHEITQHILQKTMKLLNIYYIKYSLIYRSNQIIFKSFSNYYSTFGNKFSNKF